MMGWKTKKFRIPVILTVCSLIIRGPSILGTNIIHTDGTQYATIGENLLAGEGYRGIYTGGAVDLLSSPLYPILVGVTDLLFGNLSFSAHFVSFIFGSLAVVPAYLLAKEMYDLKTAIIAGVLVSFHPHLIKFSTIATTESLFMFLLLASIYMGFIAYKNKNRLWFVFTGFSLALTFLTKPEAIGYFGMFIVLIAGHSMLFRNKDEFISYGRLCMYTVVSFTIPVIPYVMYLYNQTGRLTLGGKSGVNIIIAEYITSSDPLAYEKITYGLQSETELRTTIWNEVGTSVVQYIFSNPFDITIRIITNLATIYSDILPTIFPPLLIGLLAVGIFTPKRKKISVMELCLGIIILFPIAAYSIFFIRSRHIVPFIPILLILASAGIPPVVDWLKHISEHILDRNIENKQILLIATVMGVIILSLIFQFALMSISSSEPTEHRDAGEWIEDNTDENAIVMARKPMVSFYGDRTYWQLPYGTCNEILTFAEAKNVDYLVVDERYTEPYRPQLRFLLDGNGTSGSTFDLVYSDTDGSSLYIYELDYRMSLSNQYCDAHK